MKKRREVIIEIEREIVVEGVSERNGWCRRCHRLVEWLTAGYAAQTLQLAESTIEGLLASGRLHGAEPDRPEAPVCSNSLAEWLRHADTEVSGERLLGPGACIPCV